MLLAALLLLPSSDPGTDVLALFKSKCVSCHGVNVVPPKGRFAYVLDLQRMAGDQTKVIPGNPLASNLYRLVYSGNMPPNPSPPLSDAEKEVVRIWIAAGAPEAANDIAGPAVDSTAQPPANLPGFFLRSAVWLGKFHLLLIHFPIVLIVIAVACEVWRMRTGSALAETLLEYAMMVGAPASVLTAALGWLLALSGAGAGQPLTLAWHRWTGTATALLACLTWFLVRRDPDGWRGRAAIFGLGALCVVTAHMGGLMVQGADFLNW